MRRADLGPHQWIAASTNSVPGSCQLPVHSQYTAAEASNTKFRRSLAQVSQLEDQKINFTTK